MQITWKLTNQGLIGPEARPDFTAYEGDLPIGRVHQIEAGNGLWLWDLAFGDHRQIGVATSGWAAEGGKAGAALVEAHRVVAASRTNAA